MWPNTVVSVTFHVGFGKKQAETARFFVPDGAWMGSQIPPSFIKVRGNGPGQLEEGSMAVEASAGVRVKSARYVHEPTSRDRASP